MNIFKNIKNAIGFLTIIPLKGGEIDKGAIMYFPFAGLLIGAALSVSYLFLIKIFPLIIALIIVISLYIIITGGLHLDGLSDTIDGLAVKTAGRDKIIEVMKDSRIGAQGAAGIFILISLKLAFFNTLPGNLLPQSLAFMPVLGRCAMVLSMCLSQPARNEGLGFYFISQLKPKDMLLPALFTLAICLLLFRFKGLIILFAVFILLVLIINFFRKLIGGMTGDTIGAACEATELSFIALVYLLFKYF